MCKYISFTALTFGAKFPIALSYTLTAHQKLKNPEKYNTHWQGPIADEAVLKDQLGL